MGERKSKYGAAHKEILVAIGFLGLLLSLDGASTTAQAWEGAPPCYLPVAMCFALLIRCGPRYMPLVFFSSITAAYLNYHRPLLSWCGIPGACAVYAGYVGAAALLRKWKTDPYLSTIRDLGQFLSMSAAGAVVSTFFGVLTLYLDGLASREQIVHTALDWYASDLIGIVTFVPFLLIFVAPRLSRWMHPEGRGQQDPGESIKARELPEWIGQTIVVALAIWVSFAIPAATPYQPLYLLFIPLVWAGLRRGMRGTAFVTFVVGISMAAAAGLLQAPRGSFPRLQLATLILGLTGLCVGAAVSERRRAESELRKNERDLKQSQHVARLGSWTLELESGEVKWTEELYIMFGLKPSENAPKYREQKSLFVPESWKELSRRVDHTRRTGEPYELELQIVRSDGSRGWIRARGEAKRNQKGAIVALCGIAQDITEHKQAEDALAFKTALLEAQSETSIDGILVVDDSGHIILANKRFGFHFGVPEDLLSSRDDRLVLEYLLSKVENPEPFLEKVKYLYSRRDESSRDEFKLRSGKVFDRYSAPLLDSKGNYRGRIWYFRDITARKQSEERAQFLAQYDALTGLPNRTLLHDRLDRALARARRQKDKVGLLFIDLDRFKAINDCLGHSVGDRLLQEAAKRLRGWIREQDTVARLGGDEFLIMLSDLKRLEDAAVLAERVMDALMEEFLVSGHALKVGCSMGISVFPDHGSDSETLIKNADLAMYSAKDAGRNNYRFFSAAMNAQAGERLIFENALRSALDNKELFLRYQPQMDVASGRICGVEALLRWQHSQMGLIPPDRFIHIAESSGLIVPIGTWVLRTACAQARRWQEQGLPSIKMAVNVSVVQLRQEGFCERVREILADTGLAPENLELEITESLVLTNEELMLSILRDLRRMGVALSIDDFGTGYSSFSYLKHFRANKFKIDRSLIRDIAVNADDAAITAAIIQMAKTLRLTVIAEGVEDAAQMEFLRAHECDQIQGYYFSKPLPPEEVAQKLRSLGTPATRAATAG